MIERFFGNAFPLLQFDVRQAQFWVLKHLYIYVLLEVPPSLKAMCQQRMSIISKFISLILLVVTCQSCNFATDKSRKNSETKDSIANSNSTFTISDRKSDSINLRNLLITIYRWHEKNGKMDYYFLGKKGPRDALDTVKLDSALTKMKKTDFFSEEFLVNYEQIGQKVDQVVKHDLALSHVGIVFPFEDYDTWYGGQGGQPNWHDLTIYNLSINNGNASFKWTTTNWDSLNVRFKKENNKWKLSHLQYMDLKMY